MLVVKDPQDALRLVEGGVPIQAINVGNMHFAEGKNQIASTVSVDAEDRKAFKALSNLGSNQPFKEYLMKKRLIL